MKYNAPFRRLVHFTRFLYAPGTGKTRIFVLYAEQANKAAAVRQLLHSKSCG